MNYEANTRAWEQGDIVIHDADAKKPEMLMRVLGYHHTTGLCVTVYILDANACARPKRWENEIRFLHDPVRFGLKTIGFEGKA